MNELCGQFVCAADIPKLDAYTRIYADIAALGYGEQNRHVDSQHLGTLIRDTRQMEDIAAQALGLALTIGDLGIAEATSDNTPVRHIELSESDIVLLGAARKRAVPLGE